MSATRITSEVDFDRPGKQHGFLRVPHSVHRSAYGWLGVPVTVIAQGEGPTVVFSAGVHGDEYEGQIALSRLARDLAPAQIRGRLILLPMLNAPAAEAGLRCSPLDDGNMNRLFPGDPNGTPTQMIAHYHEEVILPLADYAVDLHSGGSSLIYPPTLLRGPAHSEREAEGLRLLTQAFDLPYAWVFTGGGGTGSTAATAMGAANRKSVINVMAELGGAGRVDPEVLSRTERGLHRILHALGMLPGYRPDSALGTRALHAQGCTYARQAGLFAPLKGIGDAVTQGEVIAHLHAPDTPGATAVPVTAHTDGLILAIRAMAPTARGDALFQIARDID